MQWWTHDSLVGRGATLQVVVPTFYFANCSENPYEIEKENL